MRLQSQLHSAFYNKTLSLAGQQGVHLTNQRTAIGRRKMQGGKGEVILVLLNHIGYSCVCARFVVAESPHVHVLLVRLVIDQWTRRKLPRNPNLLAWNLRPVAIITTRSKIDHKHIDNSLEINKNLLHDA